jgi:hypothetical protein
MRKNITGNFSMQNFLKLLKFDYKKLLETIPKFLLRFKRAGAKA